MGCKVRDRLVEGLNDLLDIDHDLVKELLTTEFDLAPDSFLQKDKNAYDKGGVKVMTALSMLGVIIDGDPIVPIFEDGVIQRFE